MYKIVIILLLYLDFNINVISNEQGQAKQARWDTDNLSDLADLYLNGEGDFEVCALLLVLIFYVNLGG